MAEGYKDWAAGDILTAADLEDYTVKQSVMRFADASARTTALSGVLAEGMMSYLKDTDSVEVYDGSAWAALGGKILQVVSTTKTDTFSTSSTSLTNITGLSASITPTSASSKVFASLTIGQTDASGAYILTFDVTRAGTPVGVGDAANNRTRAGISVVNADPTRPLSVAWSYLDSPATTSATTYQARCQTSGGTLYLNRNNSDTDIAAYARTVSTLTVMEVSA